MCELPPPAVNVTVLPEMGLPLASRSVTVMVEVVELLSGTVVGLATTVDLEVEAAPALTVKVTVPEVKVSPTA